MKSTKRLLGSAISCFDATMLLVTFWIVALRLGIQQVHSLDTVVARSCNCHNTKGQ